MAKVKKVCKMVPLVENNSVEVFQNFVKDRVKYKSRFWIAMSSKIKGLSKKEKEKCKKEIEDKNFKNDTEIWEFLDK